METLYEANKVMIPRYDVKQSNSYWNEGDIGNEKGKNKE